MAKAKKVSISTMDKMVRAYENITEVYLSDDVTVSVKKTLSLKEALGFVDAVVESCFQENVGYMPEIKEFAILKNIVERYSNISLPDDLEHQYEILYKTEIVKTILAVIDKAQYHGMIDAINEKIKIRVQMGVDEYLGKIRKVVDAIEAFSGEAHNVIGSVTKEDVEKLISFISNGVDEQKVMDAYIQSKEVRE